MKQLLFQRRLNRRDYLAEFPKATPAINHVQKETAKGSTMKSEVFLKGLLGLEFSTQQS